MGRVLHKHDSYAQDSGERQLQQNIKDAYTFCSPKEKGQMANCCTYWHSKAHAGLQTHSVPVTFLRYSHSLTPHPYPP